MINDNNSNDNYTLDKYIDEWANNYATIFVNCNFAQQIFTKENGEKYHAIPPVNFVFLPLNDGNALKRIVEFTAKVRQTIATNDDSWKANLFCKVKSWLKDEAMNVYSKLLDVDFTKFQLQENV